MSNISQITDFIRFHASLAGPVSFVVTFAGCLLGTNLVVPAGAAVTAIGILAGAGIVSSSFGIWAACGAIVGTSLSYSLGWRFGVRILTIPALKRRPNLVVRANDLFQRYGFAAIMIGYFAGPLRAIVAGVAAIAGMPRGRFEFANVLSSATWTTTSLMMGLIPGKFVATDSIWLPLTMLMIPTFPILVSFIIIYFKKKGRSVTAQMKG